MYTADILALGAACFVVWQIRAPVAQISDQRLQTIGIGVWGAMEQGTDLRLL
jgi:hypothetical protein